MSTLWKAYVVVTLLLLSSSRLLAHDLQGLDSKSVLVARALEFNRLGALASQARSPTERYVLANLELWPPGHVLKSCFYEGATDAEIDLIVEAVKIIFSDTTANISFDFGEKPNYRKCATVFSLGQMREDVRISFRHGCCSGYVGTTSHDLEAYGEGPSVSLQGVANPASTEEKKRDSMRKVLHELFHVLGLHHEHQSPDITCEKEFNKRKIQDAYGWDDEKYKKNIDQLDEDKRSYKWSKFDKNSIMRYYFDTWQFKRGEKSPCYFATRNFLPSKLDLAALLDAYPSGQAAADANERTRSVISTLATTNLPPVIREYVNISRRLMAQ
jgi:Astacin (Peptidase family M12A)